MIISLFVFIFKCIISGVRLRDGFCKAKIFVFVSEFEFLPVFAVTLRLVFVVFVHTSASCQAGKVGVVGRRGAIAGKSASRDAAL